MLLPVAVSFALAACILPPSFSDYEQQQPGTGGTGAAAAGGVGGSGGTQAAGSGGTGAVQGGAQFGEDCDARPCAQGLACSRDLDVSDWRFSQRPRPVCLDVPACGGKSFLAPCGARGGTTPGFCNLINERDLACVPSCGPNAPCPFGGECFGDPSEAGRAVCTSRCRSDADCRQPGNPYCHADGFCWDLPKPPDPTLPCTIESACLCYQDFATAGTCTIACTSDADCPTVTGSTRQMLCQLAPGFSGFSLCAVPCAQVGPNDPVCRALGLECSNRYPAKGQPTCWGKGP